MIVAVALGSNLGDRHALLADARQRLATLLTNPRFSTIIETPAEGVPEPQPPFLNAAAVGETSVPARGLLAKLQAIEAEAGRERPHRLAPRTLDLDLILFGDHVIDEPGLTVPHPRFRERRFVLEPLAEIAPALVDPVTGLSVAKLLERLLTDG